MLHAPTPSLRPRGPLGRLSLLGVVAALLGALLAPAPAPAASVGFPVGLLSINDTGTDTGNGETRGFPSLSADGTKIVFSSFASDLDPAVTDGNGTEDVFVRDLVAGTTTLVSVATNGTDSGNGASDTATISADGTRVVFTSGASDLVGTDTNGSDGSLFDVFVRDLGTGITTLVSVNETGDDSGNGDSFNPVFSPDGTKVAFESEASDLAGMDTNGAGDIYLRDLLTGTTTLASANVAGTDSHNGSGVTIGTMSDDGTRVAFTSDATDLVPGFVDGNGPATSDIFVRDLEAATTILVTVNAAGTASGSGGSFLFAGVLTADGTRVYFDSTATDLVPGFVDGNGPLESDVYVRDLDAATTTLVSVNATGTASGNAISRATFAVSADGNRIVFASAASDLAAPDTDNDDGDLFVRDVDTATTTLVTVNAAGTDSANGDASGFPAISADGNRVAFVSTAVDLTAPDTDTDDDIFVRNLNTATTTLVSVNAAGTDSGNDISEFVAISANGTRVAISSEASDLVATDTNGVSDMFEASLADTIQFAAGSYSVDEDAGTATIGLTRTGEAEGAVTVDVTTTDGTATAGADYTDADTTVTFLAGQTTAEVTVPILDDPDVEADETVALALGNPGGGAELGALIDATLTIVDIAGVGGASLTIAVEGGDPTFEIDGPVDDTVVVDPGESVTIDGLPVGEYTITLVDPDDVVVDAIDCDPEELDVDLDDRSVTIEITGADVTCDFTISDDDDYDQYPGDDDFDFDTPFDDADDADGGQVAGTNESNTTTGSQPTGDQLGTAGDPAPAGDNAPAVLDMLPRTGLGGGLTLAGALLLAAGGLASILGRRRRTNQV